MAATMTEERSLSSRSKEWGVDGDTVENLSKMGVSEYFPVQSKVLPLLMGFNSYSCLIPRDICVSAPTGSGKTLAYAVPVISILKRRTIIRIRALIVLPSRELASQVFGIFRSLSAQTDLKIMNCVGQTDFLEEQQLLVGPYATSIASCMSLEAVITNKRLYAKDPTSVTNGTSNVDIIICTPGRLMEHLQQTKGFNLQNLRFLVLDEADRLLGNAYHYWVKSLIESSQRVPSTQQRNSSSNAEKSSMLGKRNSHFMVEDIREAPLQRLLFSATLTDNPGKLALLGIRNPIIVRITGNDESYSSATANNAPNLTDSDLVDEGLVADGLITEKMDSMDKKLLFTLPSTLKEFVRICDTAVRPLHLIGILAEAIGSKLSGYDRDLYADSEHLSEAGSQQGGDGQPSSSIEAQRGPAIFSRGICSGSADMCIIFASSVETTHRLALLLQTINGQSRSDSETIFGGKVAEMSRLLTAGEREQIMADCKQGNIKILVSSDHMARGIDLPNVRLVINFDQPKFPKTYVHRVGRTARANSNGCAITLLKNGQSGNFRKMRSEITGGWQTNDSSMSKCRISKQTLENFEGLYKSSLQELRLLLEGGNVGTEDA